MKHLNFLLPGALFLASVLSGQSTFPKDPAIQSYVDKVHQDSLKAHIEKLVSFGTRHTLSSTTDTQRGIGAARQWVLSKFHNYAKNSSGRMEVFLQSKQLVSDGKRINRTTDLGNAVAVLKGTDPLDKRVFIIGGHLDSRVSDVMDALSDAPGANDDGSGVGAVLEAARVLSSARFPATIVFVAFSGEEQGLLGAHSLVEYAKKNNWHIEGVLNNDMIGNAVASETNEYNAHQVRIFSEGLPYYELDKKASRIRSLGLENDGISRQLARRIKQAEVYVDHLEVKLNYRNDRFLRGGDHTAFVMAGYPGVRITEFNENYNHQHQDLRTSNGIEYGDKIEFMDFLYYRKNTQLNIAALASMAKAPARPENVQMPVSELTNTTTLRWSAPQSGKAAGYRVLMRETDQSNWQKSYYTSELQLTLPYSKDNYFFAVQSVDSHGNSSIAVIPEVTR